jgi:hypothetical protein
MLEALPSQKSKNDKIVEDVIIEELTSNMSGTDIDGICKKVDGGKGDRSDKCYDELDGTRKSGYSTSITEGYWKAVSKGYTGSIKDFSDKKDKLKDTLSTALTVGGGLAGLFTSKSNQGTDYKEVAPIDEPKRISKTAKWVVGGSVVLALGIISFIIFRKK